jgi:hypothetical protein
MCLCERCDGTGKMLVNEPAAYGYMACDVCDGSGGACDECGRPLAAGACEWCTRDRLDGESFTSKYGMPF